VDRLFEYPALMFRSDVLGFPTQSRDPIGPSHSSIRFDGTRRHDEQQESTMKGSELLVAALENEGVDRIFGVPGEENLAVVESLRRSSIELVVTRHEQPAAFMAATYGRLTGRPGVALSTLGPGALNLVTGAAYGFLGGMPMILITGQKAIRQSRQAHFQIVDVVGAMSPLTKQSQQIVSASAIPTLVRNAFRIATEERPGPVHLELPEDVAADEAGDVPLVPVHAAELPVPSPEAIKRASDLILAAKYPLLMFGAGASRPQLAPALSEFVRRVRIPFFNTQMGKGAVGGASDFYLGTAALSERDYVHQAIDRADLIVTIGHDTVEKPPFLMARGRHQVIHIGFVPATVEEVYFPQAEVVGDIAKGLDLLASQLEGRLVMNPDWVVLRKDILAHITARAEEDRFPLTPQRIVHDVRQVMPPDGIVALDNGMYKIWFARNYRTDVANTLLLDNALATMGAGLPSGMMAALLYPKRRVLVVAGDGGFMMNSQELETARRMNLNLVVLIIEDYAYGMIRWKQAVDGFADWGLTFGNPDFVAYAAAYGARGRRVTTASGLAPALEEAFSAGGVHLIVVPIDYSENVRVLVEELKHMQD
jgi:acetolactate synthase I/II/III large subunit